MGWNKLGSFPMANLVSPPPTLGLKVICWESLSEFLFPHSISSEEFQGQRIERSQPLTSSNQINSEFWQQRVRHESFTSCYMTDNWKRRCTRMYDWHFFKVVRPWCDEAVWGKLCSFVCFVFVASKTFCHSGESLYSSGSNHIYRLFVWIFSFLKAEAGMFQTHNYSAATQRPVFFFLYTGSGSFMVQDFYQQHVPNVPSFSIRSDEPLCVSSVIKLFAQITVRWKRFYGFSPSNKIQQVAQHVAVTALNSNRGRKHTHCFLSFCWLRVKSARTRVAVILTVSYGA